MLQGISVAIVLIGVFVSFVACEFCGRIPNGAQEPLNDKYDHYYDDAEYYGVNNDEDYSTLENISEKTQDVRIVGGQEVEEIIPWFALLMIDTKNRTEPGKRCGGVLISRRFVLSAGHCFCFEDLSQTCDLMMSSEGEAFLSLSANRSLDIVALLGIRSVADLDRIPPEERFLRHQIGVSAMVVHPQFQHQGPFDVCLLRLAVELPADQWSEPICLPWGRSFPDRKVQKGVDVISVVIGMGQTTAGFGACTTTAESPKPFSQCQFPYALQSMPLKKSHGCSYGHPTPSYQRQSCREFQRSALGLGMKPKYRVRLDWGNGTSETCFDTRAHGGWCGTSETPSLEEKIVTPSPEDYWGWCGEDCFTLGEQGHANYLRTVNLEILSSRNCRRLARDPKFNSTLELCGGRKIRVDAPKIFKVRPNLPNASPPLIFQPALDGVDQRPGGWILGGQDACLGDSGGPMWIAMAQSDGSKRAYLVGIVSRGWGCAHLNSPGIYTRVKHLLHWIGQAHKELKV